MAGKLIKRDAKSGRFLEMRKYNRGRILETRKDNRGKLFEVLIAANGEILWDSRDRDISDSDNPEWTDKDFKRAKRPDELPPEVTAAFKRERGRPKKDYPKVPVSLRLDRDIIDAFKADGEGWQTRINDVLRRSLERRRKAG